MQQLRMPPQYLSGIGPAVSPATSKAELPFPNRNSTVPSQVGCSAESSSHHPDSVILHLSLPLLWLSPLLQRSGTCPPSSRPWFIPLTADHTPDL